MHLSKAVRGGDQGSIRMARAAISNRRCAEDDVDMTDVPGSLSLVFSTSPTLFSVWLHLLKQVMLPSTEFLLGKFCYCDINTGVLVRWYVETALTLWDGLSENLKRAAAAMMRSLNELTRFYSDLGTFNLNFHLRFVF